VAEPARTFSAVFAIAEVAEGHGLVLSFEKTLEFVDEGLVEDLGVGQLPRPEGRGL
jgi:hypothetical protein